MPCSGSQNRGFENIRLKKLDASSSVSRPNILSVYSHNISGAKSKIGRMNELLTLSLFDIVALQETWFDETVGDDELLRNTNYNMIRQDRRHTDHHKKGGGGIAILIRNELTFRQHVFGEIRKLQFLCMSVIKDNSTLLLINIYSPFGLLEDSIADFINLLSLINSIPRTETLIVGDFNMPMIKWYQDEEVPGSFLPFGNEKSAAFTEAVFDHGLCQIVTPPLGRNHLDIALVNDVSAFYESVPTIEEMIDRESVRHAPFVINYHVKIKSTDRIRYLNFGRTNLSRTKAQLGSIPFHMVTEEEAIFEDMSGNIQATTLIQENIHSIQDVLNRNTPFKVVGRSWLSKHPWLKNSRNYERAQQFKINAKHNLSTNPTDLNRDLYRRACFDTSNVYKQEKAAFISRVIDESRGNTFEFYSLLKGSSKMRKDTPETMLYNNEYVTGDAKLDAFAKHLSSSFLQNPPSLGESFAEIDEKLYDIYQLNFDENKSHLWTNLNFRITTDKVSQYIRELKISKDPGPMKISAEFLQFNVVTLAPVIANAINTMIFTGRIPDDWKLGYLIPIPKKGSPMSVNNYRGIAIQSCLPKLLDKFLTDLLYTFLGDSINDTQHGFRRGKGTVTNLLEVTQSLHKDIKDGQVDIIYFDYSKAFDQIRHDLLAAKLSRFGMPYNFYRILMNFVIGRKYLLKVDNVEHKISINPRSSVPQGSHFGPVLYIIFTNDVGIGEICYADDTKIKQNIRTMADRNILQEKITKLENWSIENGLTLNSEKTFHVSYGKRSISTLYFLKGQIISQKESVRDLGVIFDNKLTFSKHIEHVTTRTNQMIGAARRLVTDLKMPMLIRRIYAVYIQPIAEYCSVIWNQNRITMNAPLSLLHKKVTRIALNIFYGMNPSHYIEYNQRCEILNQDGPTIRRSTQAAMLCVKILKGDITLSFSGSMINHINMIQDARINHLLLRTDRNIPPKSPVALMLAAASKYEAVINLQLTTKTIADKIKKKNNENRTLMVESRRTSSRIFNN